MNRIKIIGATLIAAVGLLAACTKPQPPTTETKPILSADIPEFLADGTEKATFTVTYNGVDVTAQAVITNTTTNDPLTTNEFSTTTPGTYTFTATYNEQTSEAITVEALPTSDLMLTVDKESIVNNGEDMATFTVTYQGEDVTAQSVIINMTEADRWDTGVNTFKSQASGTYKFRANYQDMKSNDVMVTVTIEPQNPLVLRASTPRINANGSDAATFTVFYNGEDVTSQATITNTTTQEAVTGNSFSSAAAGLYQFTASYNDATSEAITVACGDYDFYKNVLLCRFTGASCGPCGTFSPTLSAALESYPDRVVQIAIHSDAVGPDPLVSSQFGLFMAYFFPNALPTIYYDFGEGIVPVGISAQQIVSDIQTNQAVGAKAGIAITSSMADRTATVNVRVTPSESGEYYLSVVLVEDGIPGTQANVEGTYINDDTFRNVATSVTGDALGSLQANTEITKEYTFDLSKYTDNCRIVAYVNVANGDDTYQTTNAASCPINGTTDYRFEK